VQNSLKISAFGFQKLNQTEPTMDFENQKLSFCGLVFKKPNNQFLDNILHFSQQSK